MPLSQMPNTVDIPSPCVGVCTVDDDGVCMGCDRTLDEIARWSTMSNHERQRVLRRIDNGGDTSRGAV